MAINESLNTHDWLQLSPQVRAKLIEIFHIPRSGVGHANLGPIQNVTSDGYTHEDLKAISVEKMREYLGGVSTSEDFTQLFSRVIDNFTNPTKVPEANKTPQLSQDELIQEWANALKTIRLSAEEKGLIGEYLRMLRKEVKVKK